MLKGLLMASGIITIRIMYGKAYKDHMEHLILYSLLNCLWILVFIFSVLAKEWYEKAIFIFFEALYPIIIISVAVHIRKNQKKSKQNLIKKYETDNLLNDDSSDNNLKE